MPDIPKTEYTPPVTPGQITPQQVPQPAPPAAAPSYCELATYDTAILKALLPDFVRGTIPGWATRIECDEAEARRVLSNVLRQPEIARARDEARGRWEAAKPATADAATVKKWWAAQPPSILFPAQWAAMSPADRVTWKQQVRTWIATGPEPVSPETTWARIVRLVRQHPSWAAAIGTGIVTAVAAMFIAGRRGPRRLPSVESELESHGYDRYDDQRD